jgi:hypothetical protein
LRRQHDDLAGDVAASPGGIGWADGVPLEIGEHPVTAFATDAVEE